MLKRPLSNTRHLPSLQRTANRHISSLFSKSSRKSPLFKKISTTALVLGLSSGAIYYYYCDAQSGIHQYFLLPLTRLLIDAETSHKLGIKVLEYPALSPRLAADWDDKHDPNKQLQVTLFSNSKNVKPITLRNPIGIAAGFDKDGKAIDSLLNMGFSYVEIGSITPLPQPGNPLPRLFRLEKDQAVINRYGFNSEGHLTVLARLKTRLAKALNYPLNNGNNNSLRPLSALAVNLGKNKFGDEVQDYVTGIRRFGSYADILVVNVSSPNTPGLRDLQNESKLKNLLEIVVNERNIINNRPPVLVKIAPDVTEPEIESIATAVKDSNVDGVIVSNTTIARPQSLKSSQSLAKEVGGLSGKPVRPYSLQALQLLRKHLGPDITIIGCGGISSGKDAIEFANAGADFVQLYTSFAYKGPSVCGDIKSEILEELQGRKWADIVNRNQ